MGVRWIGAETIGSDPSHPGGLRAGTFERESERSCMPPSLPACARHPGRNRNHWPRSTTLAAHMSRKTLHPAEMPDYFAMRPFRHGPSCDSQGAPPFAAGLHRKARKCGHGNVQLYVVSFGNTRRRCAPLGDLGVGVKKHPDVRYLQTHRKPHRNLHYRHRTGER